MILCGGDTERQDQRTSTYQEQSERRIYQAVTEGRIKWFDHVRRQPQENTYRQIMNMGPLGRTGRPNTRCTCAIDRKSSRISWIALACHGLDVLPHWQRFHTEKGSNRKTAEHYSFTTDLDSWKTTTFLFIQIFFIKQLTDKKRYAAILLLYKLCSLLFLALLGEQLFKGGLHQTKIWHVPWLNKLITTLCMSQQLLLASRPNAVDSCKWYSWFWLVMTNEVYWGCWLALAAPACDLCTCLFSI